MLYGPKPAEELQLYFMGAVKLVLSGQKPEVQLQ